MNAARSLALRTRLQARSLSTSARVKAGHGAPHYNQPSGYLFGEKPLPAGQKRKWEDWELVWYLGMFGSMAFAAVGLYYKPDTSIQTWALKEARERLEARGEEFTYKASSATTAPAPSEHSS
ncbi:hypothetical protein FRC04_010488 [Tulasnella sp. 424]|nr:hypothetical protein FRC04_010488 [Tulasnella sp. 424]KAG8964888.1 hypothetical protein FRC05_003544 [Tulasnella sp. 425]